MAYLMVVDDDEEFAMAVAAVLRRQGHEVAIKTDTAAAMAEMHNRRPDLAILDVMFNQDDFAGLELARAMHGQRDLAGVPILMLTGVNMKLDLKLDALDIDNSWLPVAEFMDKPVDLAELVRRAEALMH